MKLYSYPYPIFILRKRNFPKMIGVFFISFFLINCRTSSPKKKDNLRRNVLFIIADDLNCDLGSYGNKLVKTPNIDRLAKRGMLFSNAHNQYPLCGPSRASFMTGMYSDQTKIQQNNIFIRSTVPKVITMGQRFRQKGYQSVRIGKIFHYNNPSSIGTSGHDDMYTWDQTINPYGIDKKEEYKINTLSPRRYGGTLSWLASDGKDEEQTDGIGATKAMEFLEDFSKSGENFFLAVGMYRPHTPFVAPKKYFDLYIRDSITIPSSSDLYLNSLPLPAAKSIRSKKNQINLKYEVAQEIKEAYYASISFVDAQVGRILDKLKETGLEENTIIVFTSDHGYHLGEHGHWQKQTLFENATRVPLIFAGPGIKNGSEIAKAPVELLDIYPTLMELTKIETPRHVVGKSLVQILENKSKSVRKSALTKWKNGYSIKTKKFRFTQWGENGELGYELYDHTSDKQELINLAGDSNYSSTMISLKNEIDIRIAEAKLKPKGLGRQITGVKPTNLGPNMTYGDEYDIYGKRIYLKE